MFYRRDIKRTTTLELNRTTNFVHEKYQVTRLVTTKIMKKLIRLISKFCLHHSPKNAFAKVMMQSSYAEVNINHSKCTPRKLTWST